MVSQRFVIPSEARNLFFAASAPEEQPRSGERMQPTACPEPAEGAQAVGQCVNRSSPEGAKDFEAYAFIERIHTCEKK